MWFRAYGDGGGHNILWEFLYNVRKYSRNVGVLFDVQSKLAFAALKSEYHGGRLMDMLRVAELRLRMVNMLRLR